MEQVKKEEKGDAWALINSLCWFCNSVNMKLMLRQEVHQ